MSKLIYTYINLNLPNKFHQQETAESPADEEPDHIGMADINFVTILLLLRICSVEILPKCCLDPRSLLVKLTQIQHCKTDNFRQSLIHLIK